MSILIKLLLLALFLILASVGAIKLITLLLDYDVPPPLNYYSGIFFSTLVLNMLIWWDMSKREWDSEEEEGCETVNMAGRFSYIIHAGRSNFLVLNMRSLGVTPPFLNFLFLSGSLGSMREPINFSCDYLALD